jgi:ferritin-like metal-binding protein YciE
MSTIQSLEDIYAHELKDLWSANDQMERTVLDLAEAASDDGLIERLKESAEEIGEHTKLVKSLIGDLGEDCEKSHCKGMEGLVKEARKHALDEDFEDEALQDVVIIAQYQRMAHYGICGFGTVAALARAAGHEEHVAKLEAVLDDIYGADRYMTELAERSINLRASDVEADDDQEEDA